MRIYNIAIMLVVALFMVMSPTNSSAAIVNNSLSTITSTIEDIVDIFKSFESTPTGDKSIKKKKWKDYNHGDDDDDDNGNDIPLDGGLSFLAIAGVGLGIKKVIDHRSKNK